jgi:hypothetical protein
MNTEGEGRLCRGVTGCQRSRDASPDLPESIPETDARDAYIVAEAARSMPHTLRSLKLADDELAELTMLCGFDDDLAGQITQDQQSHPWPADADHPP